MCDRINAKNAAEYQCQHLSSTLVTLHTKIGINAVDSGAYGFIQKQHEPTDPHAQNHQANSKVL